LSAPKTAEPQRIRVQIEAAERKAQAQVDAERQQIKAHALAELNDRAATGDSYAIQDLSHFASLGEDARSGLTAATAGGSRLAAFIMAVWNHKSGDNSIRLEPPIPWHPWFAPSMETNHAPATSKSTF
jgi:hypothetical protein